MKRSLSILMLLAMLMMIFAIPTAAGEEQTRYVVVFKGNGIPKNAEKTIAKAGGELVKTFPEVGLGIAISSNPKFASSLRGAQGIQSIGFERFQRLPDDEVYEFFEAEPDPGVDTYYYAYQWDIRRVKADMAWDIASGSHDTVVAILDTGIAWNHPDLAPNVVYAACYSTQPTCSPYPDLHWHGTHVAGTVAAAFSGGKVVGVGPNLGLAGYNVFELYIDPVEGPMVVAYDEALWEAMLNVAANGFDVINMSLGGYVVKPASQEDVAAWTAWNRVVDYVNRQGVAVVASSGNADFNLNGPVDHIPSDLPGVVGVGATGIRPNAEYPQPGSYDVRAFYSNFGAAVTLVAPGGDLGPDGTEYPFPAAYYFIMSADVDPNPTCAMEASCPWGYAWAIGTSMASPHVAGAAGLVMDMNPGLNPHQVTSILKRTAESLGDRQQFGHGMLDVEAAVNE